MQHTQPQRFEDWVARYGDNSAPDLVIRGVMRACKLIARWLETAAGYLSDHRLVLSREAKQLIAPNKALHGRHQGRRCFIIGNGPSLSTQNLTPLAGEITFAMNSFYLHSITAKWSPTYYNLLDDFLFDGSDLRKQFYRDLRQRVPTSTFLVPLYYANVVREQQLLPLEQVHYVAYRGFFPPDWSDRFDLTGQVPLSWNTVHACLAAAIAMGCTPIYLMGLDHDLLAHQGANRHFYPGFGGHDNDPKFRKNTTDFSYKSLMYCMMKMWEHYELILRMALREGIRIYNATNGGFLDVFERVRYEDVVGLPTSLGV